MARAQRGMEALEIDAVVDDGQARRRHRIVPCDVVGTAAGDGDDLGRAREDAPLERKRDRVMHTASPARGHRLEVGAVRALARAIDVLHERALVALHDVPAAPSRNRRGEQRQRDGARRRRQRRHRQRMLGHAGLRLLAARARAMHVVAVGHERAHQPCRRALDPAVKRVRAGDDQDLHRGATAQGTAAAGPVLFEHANRHRVAPVMGPQYIAGTDAVRRSHGSHRTGPAAAALCADHRRRRPA